MSLIFYIAVGIVAGVCSGLFGIGGGVVIVPALVLLGRLPQHAAVGTSLVALLLPVGAAAVFEYYHAGKIVRADVMHGLLIGGGICLGGLVGARLGLGLSEIYLRQGFAVFTILIGVRMLLA